MPHVCRDCVLAHRDYSGASRNIAERENTQWVRYNPKENSRSATGAVGESEGGSEEVGVVPRMLGSSFGTTGVQMSREKEWLSGS
jgi:hypothetical protein